MMWACLDTEKQLVGSSGGGGACYQLNSVYRERWDNLHLHLDLDAKWKSDPVPNIRKSPRKALNYSLNLMVVVFFLQWLPS